MNRQVRLGAFIVTFTTSMEGFAQGQTSSSIPAAAASKASDPKTDVLPGGNVTWLVVGLVIGFVAGYIVGKNSARTAAAR